MSRRLDNAKIIFLFIIARVVLFLSLPLEGLRSYGDYWNFYHIAELGWPYLNHWVEFPPVFPLLARSLYLLVGGRQHAFEYILAFLMTFVQAINIYLVQIISERIYSQRKGWDRFWVYFAVLAGLFYGWAYFDPLGVLALLLSIYWLLRNNDNALALSLGLGALFKWFPLLALPVVWKKRTWKRATKITLVTIGLVFIAWGLLYVISPDMTIASVASQYSKGSWESIWALVDGNLQTGNFGGDVNRRDPHTAYLTSGNPSRIPSWMTLIIFGGFGLWIFLKAQIDTDRQTLSFIALTTIIFFIWSPGYSPQWVLYLLPFVFILLDRRQSILFGISFILINLIEWPLLLSRGLFQGLYITVPLRTFAYTLLGIVLISHVGFREREEV